MALTTQLAAIMLTDIIGIEDILSKDEAQAKELIAKNRFVQKPLVEKHKGKWLKESENGSWACFDNSLDAVNCARQVQATLKLEPNLEVRINIHLGEVTFDENQVFGEAINIASEISAKDGKSGIYISEAIYDTIKHNEKAGLSRIGGAPSTPGKLVSLEEKEDSTKPKTDEDAEPSMDEAFLNKLTEVVEANIENEQFSVEDLAEEVAISRSHIHRKLQSLTGQSISQFIRSIRLRDSMELLRKEVATVSEIAYRVGFGSPTYFIKCFHEYYGYPPGEVKKRQLDQIQEGGDIETEFLGEKLFQEESEPVKLYQIKDTWNAAISHRQLAAIMFTDIVGYTAIMSEDEARGLKLVEKNRQLHKPLIESHRGTWIKEMGDGIMSYFGSAYDAVNCAIEIQRKLSQDPEFKLRVGIHLGDIVFQEGDVFGDGVNLASRLLPVGDPGSVMISEKVFDEIENKPGIDTQFLGTYNLKGINRPVGIFAVTNEGLIIPDAEQIREKLRPSDMEGLQPIKTQALIMDVFEEMVKHKPTLEKYTLLDEDEDEEDIDVRLLAHQIVKNFPWPMGVELRRLFSGSMRQMSLGRLNQLVKSIERSFHLLNFILVTELCEFSIKKKIKLDSEFRELFREKFRSLRTADVTWMIKEISHRINREGLSYFMPEMEDLFSPQFFESMEAWIAETKWLEENRGALTPEDISGKCLELEEHLATLLKRMAFIIKYRLVNVGTIKVLKSKHKEARFEHAIDILNSSDSDFRTREEIMATFSDSRAVLLMKNIKDPEHFLNLSPLVIDTHTESIDSRDKAKLKKDIFLYHRFDGKNMHHIGTEVTETCDLSSLSNYENLVEEFNELMFHLGRNGEAKK